MKARVLWSTCVIAALGCIGSGLALAQSAVDCSSVTEDMARLKCYDEQAARQKKANAAPSATPSAKASAPTAPSAAPSANASAPAAASAAPPAKASAPAAANPASASAAPSAASTAPATSAPAAPATSAASASRSSSSDFGLDAEVLRKRQAAANPSAPKEPDQIVARVQSVVTKPRGEYRITLDDGQVWEETQHSSSNRAPEVGETITIKRGMLGSYFLSHSVGLALRVKRIN